MFGLLELDERQVAEQDAMAPGGPNVVQRTFDVEKIAGDAGAGEAHGTVLAARVERGPARRR